jgi:hypothetical protein
MRGPLLEANCVPYFYLLAAFWKRKSPVEVAISGKRTYHSGSNLLIRIHELDRERRDSPQTNWLEPR